MGKLYLKEITVFNGYEGWKHNGLTYRLACNPVLAEAPNSDLLCTWLSGTDNEPSADNCILAARSTDGGLHWSEPQIFIPAGKMAGGGCILPLLSLKGEMLAFSVQWPADKNYTQWHYSLLRSTDNGLTWGLAAPLALRGESNYALGMPVPMPDGSVLFAASTFMERKKPLGGPLLALCDARSEEAAAAIAPDPRQYVWDPQEGKNPHYKFVSHLHGCGVIRFTNADLTNYQILGSVQNRPLGLLEPTLLPLAGGRLVMLMRAEWGGFLWRTESCDGGITWLPAWQTNIKNPTSLPFLLRLRDGRIVLLHNHTGGQYGFWGWRSPLSIWVSEDELASFSIKEDVFSGTEQNYAYPNGLVLRNPTSDFVFAYDHNRRRVQFVFADIQK